jgi:outer membrane protein OmpA-like peptidoglycan-associated protein
MRRAWRTAAVAFISVVALPLVINLVSNKIPVSSSWVPVIAIVAAVLVIVLVVDAVRKPDSGGPPLGGLPRTGRTVGWLARKARRWLRSHAGTVTGSGVILVAVAFVVVACTNGWLTPAVSPSSNTAGRCDVPAGEPLAVAVSGRANSPQYSDSRPLESILFNVVAPDQPRAITLVNVDGAPRVVGDAGPAPDRRTARGDYQDELQRYLTSFVDQAKNVRADHPEVDVLTALDTAARAVHATSDEGLVVLIDSGLSTTGSVDFTVPGMTYAEPSDVTDFLQKNDLLPDFRGITVVLIGVGEVAPPQQVLLPGQRDRLADIWTHVLSTAGARCVTLIDQPRLTDAPTDVPPVTAVPLPPAPAFTPPPVGVPGKDLVLPNDDSTGFMPDTDELLDPAKARRLLIPVADWLAEDPTRRVTITGTTADFGSREDQVAVSKRRADTIAALLEDLDVPSNQLTTVGVGSDFPEYVTDTGPRGEVLPAQAGANRTVRISFGIA